MVPMVDFTVAIPTYNGEHRLPLVLERLRSQLNTAHFSWVVIVVDNNSTDHTAEVVRHYQDLYLADKNDISLFYCVELQQGSGFARKRAMQEAESDLVGFLDDDNIPDPHWVSAAYQFAQEHPKAGAYGSRIDGEFETDVPPELEKLLPFLAITKRGMVPLLYRPDQKILPPSAGLVLRKQAWQEAVPDHMILVGRIHGNMLAGEDTELLAHIQRSPWEIWYNPAMNVVHKIPETRLQREYLLPLFRGIGLSRHVSRMLSVRDWQQPIMFFAYLINDLRKIIQYQFKYGRKLKNNLVLACEFELLTHSLASPFYLWTNGYLRTKK
ncbi:MAG: glycosyltransferase family 2 protein [Symploca sp. SIO2B6]|nr:glycosyltransferase family 2 protein [Symploca sp. SIO2B6]